MKAIVCKEFAAVDDLSWEEVPDPIAGENEVVIDVKAAGLNYPDNLIVQGLYQFRPDLPFSPGHEGAGTIADIGKNVSSFSVGDRVSFFNGFGAFAEKIVVPEPLVFPLPKNLPLDVAGGMFMVYSTSLLALKQRAGIKAGDEVLVLGAAGGVGLAAVDLAKAYGARVVAAVSTEEKAALCRKYGADDVVIYGTKKLDKEAQVSFGKELKAKSKKGGYNIIYDPVGDCYAVPALRSIGWKGTYLVVGFAAGEIPVFPAKLMLLKGCQVSGVFIGRFQAEEPKANVENLIELGRLLASGKIRPFVSKAVPMKEAVGSIKAIAERGVVGKVVFVNK